MVPEVTLAVTGRRLEGQPALLPGFACYRMWGQSYPGIWETPGADTRGILYRHVDAHTMRLLDAFEGTAYRRRKVDVTTGGTSVETFVYTPRLRSDLSEEEWDIEQFIRWHLKDFLRSYKGFGAARTGGAPDPP